MVTWGSLRMCGAKSWTSQNEAPGKLPRMTLTFRSPDKKFSAFHLVFFPLYVLVLFSLTFVLSGGLELVSSSSFFPWFSLQESYHLRCCPVSNSVSLVSPQSFQTGIPCIGFDIPLLWHPIESLLSINYTTINESFLFDTVLAASANGIWNMIIAKLVWFAFLYILFFQLTQ